MSRMPVIFELHKQSSSDGRSLSRRLGLAVLSFLLLLLVLSPTNRASAQTWVQGPCECLGDEIPDQQTLCAQVPPDDKFAAPGGLGNPANKSTCWVQHNGQGMHYFDAYVFEVNSTSTWTLVTVPDDFDSMLYVFRHSFDPAFPCKTLLAAVDGPGYRGETLEIELDPDTYFLAVSSLAEWDDPDDDGKGEYYVKVLVPPGESFSFTPAQYNGTSHSWGYPFCNGQPYISAIFDHEFPQLPFFDVNPVRAYTNDSRDQCNPGSKNYSTGTQRRCWAYNGHNGWDYKGSYKPVFAVDSGEVVLAGVERGNAIIGGWHEICDRDERAGLGIQIHHLEGDVDSWYAHLSAIYVEAGQSVNKGQLIGLMGRTGTTVSKHLHFMASEPVAQTAWYGTEYPGLAAFDPYGWSPGDSTADPWPTQKGGAVSRRMILPGANDNGAECPRASTSCGPRRTVDDSEPCSLYGPDCFRDISGSWNENDKIGLKGDRSGVKGTHYASPSRSKVSSAEVSWKFEPVDPNKLYKVEVYVPQKSPDRITIGDNATRAARYTIQGTGHTADPVVTIDQWEHRNGGARGRWITIGWYKFGTGVADIRLGNAAFYAHPNPDVEYIEGLCVPSIKIFADKVRITPECNWEDVPGGGPGPFGGGGGGV